MPSAQDGLPAGISRAAGAGWERPPGQFFDTKRGVAPNPAPYDPELLGQRGEFATGTTGIVSAGMAQAVAKGGVALVA